MKMLNATWISAMLQPCAFCIGLTNSVHEYCRLAISTMQSTPSHNCTQRPDGGALVCDIRNLPRTSCRSVTVSPLHTLRPNGDTSNQVFRSRCARPQAG